MAARASGQPVLCAFSVLAPAGRQQPRLPAAAILAPAVGKQSVLGRQGTGARTIDPRGDHGCVCVGPDHEPGECKRMILGRAE